MEKIMKKNNLLFVIWGVIVVILVALLTTMGFMLKGKNEDYEKIEKRLKEAASSYVDHNFLYPEGDEKLKILSKDLIDNGFLKYEELKVNNDVCTGYVILSKDMVYEYDVFIKCNNYTTKGYKK